jgi:carboxypeptidase D
MNSPLTNPVSFNLTDVQKAINAPIGNWEECSSGDVFVNGTDSSSPSALSVLPNVIEHADRVIIGHGILDMVLIWNGTLVATQNMTWNGAQGFSLPPSEWDDFYVPPNNLLEEGMSDANADEGAQKLAVLAGAGNMGKTHSERGLTLVTVQLSGHMIPQYAPSASFRHLEFLLGRIESLNSTEGWTTA